MSRQPRGLGRNGRLACSLGAQALHTDFWAQIPFLPLAGCVTLGKVLTLSFLTLTGRDYNPHPTLLL